MSYPIKSIIFELSAVVNYNFRELGVVEFFPYFYQTIRDLKTKTDACNSALVSFLDKKISGEFVEKLKLNRSFFFGNDIYYFDDGIDESLDEEKINEKIRELYVRAAIGSRFDLTKSLIITGNYYGYLAALTCNLPCVVIKPDLEDTDTRYSKALHMYRSYDEFIEKPEILSEIIKGYRDL